jgi:DNA-binding MarR family transcriptional regulator
VEQDVIDGICAQLADLGIGADADGLVITGRILRLARQIEAAREAQLAEFDLSVGDFDVLATLLRQARPGGIKAKDLQASVVITSGGLTKRLDRLQAAGLLERRDDPQDRRGVLITLSRAGRDLIQEALPTLLAAEAERIRRAIGSDRDRERLAGLLRRLLRSLDTPRGSAT